MFEPPRRVLIAAVSTLFVVSSTGWALSPILFVHAPLLLVALSPLPRHVMMVAPLVDFRTLVVVVVLRRQLSCFVAYFLGQAYGQQALGFAEVRRPRMGRVLRAVVKIFDRAGPLSLFLAPNLVAVLAGSARTRWAVFVPMTLLGQVWLATVTYRVGDALKEYILPLMDFVGVHMVPLTLLMIALVVWRQIRQRRRQAARASRDSRATIESLPPPDSM